MYEVVGVFFGAYVVDNIAKLRWKIEERRRRDGG
jgi:hypothetical protein